MTELQVHTENTELAELIEWALRTARGHLVPGGTVGPSNVDEDHPSGTGMVLYTPSYRAGYAHRSGFYLRDVAHQLVGAHLLGLQSENMAMLSAFVASADLAHGGWPVWALNFDGRTPLAIDHRSSTDFVRELPGTFELVESLQVLQRWSGQSIDRASAVFAVRTVTEFVQERARGPVAAASGRSIFDGVPSYNELPEVLLAESGDAVASQYSATRHAAALRTDAAASRCATRLADEAEQLRTYYQDHWSSGAGPEVVSGRSADGTPVTRWGRERTWFPLLKGLLRECSRAERELHRVDMLCRDAQTAPHNIEALTYLPEVFLRHGDPETAWSWMRMIHARRDEPHPVSLQGAAGSYPEVSFTLVAQAVSGFLGLGPDAARRRLTTRPCLPSGVRTLVATGIPFADGHLDVGCEGTLHWIRNGTTRPLHWTNLEHAPGEFNDPHLEPEHTSMITIPPRRTGPGRAAILKFGDAWSGGRGCPFSDRGRRRRAANPKLGIHE